MRLELGRFPVERVVFGGFTRWQDGVLEIDREEIEALALSDRNIARVSVDLTGPGESVRLVNLRNTVQPQVKVDGPGVTYPGVFGRSVEMVGSGRTHRLTGVSVLECADPGGLTEEEQKAPPLRVGRGFVDMSGPGGGTPTSQTCNVCLTLQARGGLAGEDWYSAIGAAVLRVSDRLAATTLGLDPPELEAFDLTPKPGLPGAVSVLNLASDEWFVGARSVLGTAVYGQTRLSAPWLLSPTEMMDGAVYQRGNMITMSENPVVMKMAREHGGRINHLGVIIQRTNWTTQSEKEMASSRLAHLAASVGASGAVLTTDIRGQRFVEAILAVQACERAGIKTVLLTPEEDNEDGTVPPLLISAPEVVSVVSTGTSGQEEQFPSVERVLGAFDTDSEMYEPQAPIHGQYALSYFQDIYGFGRQGCVDY